MLGKSGVVKEVDAGRDVVQVLAIASS